MVEIFVQKRCGVSSKVTCLGIRGIRGGMSVMFMPRSEKKM